MNSKFLKITTLLAAALLSCQKQVPVVKVTGVNITPSEITISLGEAHALNAVITPDNASDKAVKWNTSNVEVAYVSEGKVLGLSAGEAFISATTLDGGFVSQCKVTVLQGIIHVSSITVTPHELNLEEGQSATITATVLPANADDRLYTWESSNRDVATVDQTGKVTALKAGEATISATANDGGLSDCCKVTVDIVRPKSVTLDVNELNMFRGDEYSLIATVLPAEAVDKSVTWRSSDDSVASVDANGKITAVDEGQTTITVTTADGGKTATCDVTVKICRPESVSLNYSTFAMSKGGTLQLTATVSPEKAENKNVTWATSDSDKATVDQNGLVKAVGPGEAVITVTTVDGGKTATCAITIQDSGDFTGGNENYQEEELN